MLMINYILTVNPERRQAITPTVVEETAFARGVGFIYD